MIALTGVRGTLGMIFVHLCSTSIVPKAFFPHPCLSEVLQAEMTLTSPLVFLSYPSFQTLCKSCLLHKAFLVSVESNPCPERLWDICHPLLYLH